MRTVIGSSFSTFVSMSTWLRTVIVVPVGGVMKRWNVATTSSAVNAPPSCHLPPLRRKNVYVFPSRETSQRSARSGTSCLKPLGMSFSTLKYKDVDPVRRAELRRAWNEPVLWPAYALAALVVVAVVPGVLTYFRERQ